MPLNLVLSAFNEVSAQRFYLKLELRSQVGQKVYFVLGNMNIAPTRARSNEDFTEEI